ncbi:MAG: hypothetical protein Q4E73_06540, partial [Lachnospiraceae bacterium]|nr:hypothetical protein [Lachnospiraceae bacterium]
PSGTEGFREFEADLSALFSSQSLKKAGMSRKVSINQKLKNIIQYAILNSRNSKEKIMEAVHDA